MLPSTLGSRAKTSRWEGAGEPGLAGSLDPALLTLPVVCTGRAQNVGKAGGLLGGGSIRAKRRGWGPQGGHLP